MTSVEQLIGNLLLRHNCVIIPSFGGFVAQRVSARIDYKSGTMLPPGKSILFNRQLLNNDGLLVNEFANENKVSYDEAAKELKSLVESWHATLKDGGRIEIERVGNLFYDDERNICFEQDRFANLLLESFGLSSVHFVSEEDVRIVEQKISVKETAPIVEEEEKQTTPIVPIEKAAKTEESKPEEKEQITRIVPIAKPTPVASTEEVVPEPKAEDPKPRNRAWRYVAAACILPIAFYSIWIPAKTDVLESGMLSFSDFNPFHKREEGTYKPVKKSSTVEQEKTEGKSLSERIADIPEDIKFYTYEFSGDTYIKVALPEKKVAASVETSNESQTEVVSNETKQDFNANTMHYVVGCFGDKSNADNLVAKLRANGMDASIVDMKGGLHRVSAGGAISEEAYQTIKLKADAMGLTGWRLR
ncbi:MAG: SPOR domain-containing protein [bacterium]|nr:SPOR domain-containing protein [bacterium]